MVLIVRQQTYLIRKGARYHFRRRMRRDGANHPITITLGTADPGEARRLANRLAVKWDEMDMLLGPKIERNLLSLEERDMLFKKAMVDELAHATASFTALTGASVPNTLMHEVMATAYRIVARVPHNASEIAIAIIKAEIADGWSDQQYDLLMTVLNLLVTPMSVSRTDALDALSAMGVVINAGTLFDTRAQLLNGCAEAHARAVLHAHPMIAAADARDEGAEATPFALPDMPLSEHVVADYQTMRLSLKAHPMAFFRSDLAGRGFTPASNLRRCKNGSHIDVAGIVLIRQRPGSAKGVCFITLEDESGVINLVIWPDMMEKYRKTVMASRLMEVRGRIEFDDEVTHVIATGLTDASHKLAELSEDSFAPEVARADHVNSPLPSKLAAGSASLPAMQSAHPRNAKIIPRSRDFH